MRRGGYLPSPSMPLLCSVKKGKPYHIEFTAINAGAAKNAFGIFHFIGLNHHFNWKAHRAVLCTCVTMVAILRLRFQL
jgi:hypothetical protein